MKSFYKYIILSTIFAALGVVPAYLFHKYEVLTIDERFYWEQWKQTDEGKIGPMIHFVGEPVIDFGVIDPTAIHTREFILENIGDQILEIWTEPAPDRIVKVDLSEQKVKIPERSSYPITFSVDGRNVTDDLNETIIIQSNDGREDSRTLEITITGSFAK